jgi:hypothetical protein
MNRALTRILLAPGLRLSGLGVLVGHDPISFFAFFAPFAVKYPIPNHFISCSCAESRSSWYKTLLQTNGPTLLERVCAFPRIGHARISNLAP